MIEHALLRVYGQNSPDLLRLKRNQRRTDIFLALFSLAIAALLPFVYAAFLPDTNIEDVLDSRGSTHIFLNAVANALVMIWALRINGRFDKKLAAVLSRVILVHGVFAFGILVTRQAYSNQVMLMAVGASAMLGSAIISFRHRAVAVRAALLGPWHPLLDQVQVPCDPIVDPATNLDPYDILLTPSVIDLAPEWATVISKAMLMGKPVRLLVEFVEDRQGIVSLEHFDFEHLPEAGLTSYRTRKRLLDIALVLLALPVALPILAIGAALVLLTMGQPIFFIQSRVGLAGRHFDMFKLRTMQVPAPRDSVKATASRDDVRITPIGRWLRRFRVDELPQLWNVLIGDMSVIGPRPEWTLLSDSYVERLPVYAYRHLVRPGITGWAQVKGGYAADLAETRAKVGYDLFYIKNLSFSLDVQILFRTIWTLLSGSGAR
jgi:lipopolysaccharide/colanic/teichoic acid biosynthesis glycosyltransferase